MACPATQQLKKFLSDELSDDEHSALVAHVAGCARCQTTLEELTSDSAPVTVSPAATEPGLRELIDRLRERPLTSWSVVTEPAGVSKTHRFAGPFSDTAPLGWLGPYQIEAELGSGGTGQVFAARDSRLGRRVAIKVLRPQWAGHAEARSRFEREARAVAALEDERIVKVFEVGTTPDGAPFLVMEFVDGESLEARLTRERALSPREAASIAVQVALGLSQAHRRGIVHRDVKPGNVLLEGVESRESSVESEGDGPGSRHSSLSSGLRIKLADFGLARVAEATEQLTQEGFIAGTPAYMSPEQIRRPQEADARSDVYSAGVLLYEMLTGERPFRGVVRMVLSQALHDEPIPPRQLNDRVPRDLETICLKAMSKEPSRRYLTASELADDLQRWLNGESVVARPIGAVGRTWRWCRRNPMLATLNIVVAVVLLAGAVDVARYARPSERAMHEVIVARHHAEQSRQMAEQLRVELSQHRERQIDAALLRVRLAESSRQLNRQSEAETLVADSLRELDDLERDAVDSIEISELADARGRLAEMLSWLGRADEARNQLRASGRSLGRLASQSESSSRQLREALAASGRLANDLLERREFAEAFLVLDPAAVWADRLLKAEDVTFTDQQSAVLVFRNLAVVARRLNRRAEAEHRLEQLEQLLSRLEAVKRQPAQAEQEDWITSQRRLLVELRMAVAE